MTRSNEHQVEIVRPISVNGMRYYMSIHRAFYEKNQIGDGEHDRVVALHPMTNWLMARSIKTFRDEGQLYFSSAVNDFSFWQLDFTDLQTMAEFLLMCWYEDEPT